MELVYPVSYVVINKGVKPLRITVVWLEPAEESRAFHCIECGKFQFYIQHRIIALVQEDMTHILKSPPLTLKCRKCEHSYKIHIQ